MFTIELKDLFEGTVNPPHRWTCQECGWKSNQFKWDKPPKDT